MRDFFSKAAPVRFPAEFPVRVIVFKDREEFAQQASNSVQVAYYNAGARRDYIVMSDASAESHAIAAHEYMHLIVRRSGLRIPVWLNEGLADVYSTLRPVREGIAVGDLIPGRMQALSAGKWLTFDELSSVDAHSPVYNESARVGVFYGESWALAHMLFLSSPYRENFGRFLMALNSGKTSGEACEIAFGQTPDRVYQDLKKYLDRHSLSGRIFVTAPGSSRTEPREAILTDFDSRLMMADLLLDTGRLDRARAEFLALEQQQPNRTEIAISLGYLAVVAHQGEQARNYFEKALAAGTTDPQVCLALAILEREEKQPDAKVIQPLERAVQLKPDYVEALLQLGLMRIKRREYDAAVAILMSIRNVTPAQAGPVFSALAYAYLETGDLKSAAENAAKAQHFMKDAGQASGLASLKSLIDARSKLSPPPAPGEKLQRGEGILENLDCGTRPRRLEVMGPSGRMSFSLPDVAAVELSREGGGAVDLACGILGHKKVVVYYAPDRTIRQLEY